jgi:hypothetical protein
MRLRGQALLNPGAHKIGGWVRPRDSLGIFKQTKTSSPLPEINEVLSQFYIIHTACVRNTFCVIPTYCTY